MVVIVGIHFGQQPGRTSIRGEQLDHRSGVEVFLSEGLPAIGQQLRALFVRDELRHGLLLGRNQGGIARDRKQHAAAQASGFEDGRQDASVHRTRRP